MTDQIELRNGEIVFKEDTFSGLDTAELAISEEERGDYEVYLDVQGTVPLNEFIVETESGRMELDLSEFPTSLVEIRDADTESEDDEVEISDGVEHTSRENMPPIPDDDNLQTEADRAHYRRLVRNPDSQPAQYRRLIRNEGTISRPRLDRLAAQQGFEPETGGSHNASLLMLERIGEIDRQGSGETQTIKWVGE